MISRESLVILIALVILTVPQLGIPSAWKEYVLYGCGALLLMVGYLLRRAAYWRRLDRGNGERGTDTFLESHQERINFKETTDE